MFVYVICFVFDLPYTACGGTAKTVFSAASLFYGDIFVITRFLLPKVVCPKQYCRFLTTFLFEILLYVIYILFRKWSD